MQGTPKISYLDPSFRQPPWPSPRPGSNTVYLPLPRNNTPHRQRILGWQTVGPKSILKGSTKPKKLAPIIEYVPSNDQAALAQFPAARKLIQQAEARYAVRQRGGLGRQDPPIRPEQLQYIEFVYGRPIEDIAKTWRLETEGDAVRLINKNPHPYYEHWRREQVKLGRRAGYQDRLTSLYGNPVPAEKQPAKKTDLQLVVESRQRYREEALKEVEGLHERAAEATRKRKFEELQSEPEDGTLYPTGEEDCVQLFGVRVPGAWPEEDDEREPTAEEYLAAVDKAPAHRFQDSALRERKLVVKAERRLQVRQSTVQSVGRCAVPFAFAGVFAVSAVCKLAEAAAFSARWIRRQAHKKTRRSRKVVKFAETVSYSLAVSPSKRRRCEDERTVEVRSRGAENAVLHSRQQQQRRPQESPKQQDSSDRLIEVFEQLSAERQANEVAEKERAQKALEEQRVREAAESQRPRQLHQVYSEEFTKEDEEALIAQYGSEYDFRDVPLPSIPSSPELASTSSPTRAGHGPVNTSSRVSIPERTPATPKHITGQAQGAQSLPVPNVSSFSPRSRRDSSLTEAQLSENIAHGPSTPSRKTSVNVHTPTVDFLSTPSKQLQQELSTAANMESSSTPTQPARQPGMFESWRNSVASFASYWWTPNTSALNVARQQELEYSSPDIRQDIARATSEARAKRARRKQKTTARRTVARHDKSVAGSSTDEDMDWQAADADQDTSSESGQTPTQSSSSSSSEDELAGPGHAATVRNNTTGSRSRQDANGELESRFAAVTLQKPASTFFGTKRVTPVPRQSELGKPPKRPHTRPVVSESRQLQRLQRQQAQEAEAKRLREEEAERKRKEEEEAKRKAEEEAASKARKQGLLVSPTKPAIPPLPRVWRQRLTEAMASTDRTKVLATSPKNTELSRKAFGTCLPQQSDAAHGWLNDEIIMSYLEHVVDYGNGLSEGNPRPKQALSGKGDGEVPRYVAFNSNLYNSIAEKGAQSVARWPKRQGVAGARMLEAEIIFVPINKGSHWTMVAIRPKQKRVEYYDSMGNRPGNVYAHISSFLANQLQGLYQQDEWTFTMPQCPQQDNGSDCGVFAVTAAQMLTLGLNPLQSYGASDMQTQRQRILALLMNGGFTGPHFMPEDPLAAYMQAT